MKLSPVVQVQPPIAVLAPCTYLPGQHRDTEYTARATLN